MRASPPPRSDAVPRRWTLRTAGGEVDVEVSAPEEAVLADVRAALARAGLPAEVLWAGSRSLPGDTSLTDPALRHGARLGVGRPGPRAPEPGGALELQVCGGPGAGRTHPLTRGVLVVGRGSGAGDPVGQVPLARLALPDGEVSRAHVEVAVTGAGVTVRDLGSANGTRLTRTAAGGGGACEVGADPVVWPLGAVLRIGASSVRLVAPHAPPVGAGPAPGGRQRVRPADRAGHPVVAAVVVDVPGAPPAPPHRSPAWPAIALPAVGGAAMAWVLSAPQFLLLALLGPLVALGTWGSDRWSGRRGHRRRTADHAVALTGVAGEVDRAVAEELALRDLWTPDPATLAAAAARRSAPLWARGAADPDLLVLRLGTGPGTTAVVRRTADAPDAPEPADRVPVTVDLRGRGLDLRGPRAAVLGLLRSLVCQTAVLHPPDAVRITVLTAPGGLPDWRWTRWLPHVRVTTGADPGSPGGAAHLLVVDGAPPDDAVVTRTGPVPRTGVVVVGTGGPPREDRPVVLEVAGGTDGRARLHHPGGSVQVVDLDLVDAGVADRVALDLAPLTVPRAAAGIPAQVRWRDLVHDAPPRWSRSRSHLTCVLGTGASGPVALDLCAAGPHAVVAGTTGAGKSELLRTLVLGLAAAHPPDLCSFLLVDYKGGSAFAEAADLPHTVGVLTDLDGASTARALRSLGAELTRRERLLAGHGARDLADLGPQVLAPRLVIVVDEFATLGDELPGFVPGLVAIAQRGRSLGVHLVLATQRPSGSVGPEIRANCSVRLCLRTTDEAGSRDVLGVPDAAWLPVDRPGRALLRVGGAAPVPLQVARVGGSGPTAGPGAVTARRWRWPAEPVHELPADPAHRTDLADEVAHLRTRATAEDLPVPPRPWLPALPDRVLPGTVRADPARPARVLTWGLVDRPEVQRQDPLLVDLAAGGCWLVVGGPGSGRSTALVTLLAAAVDRLVPDEVHVHAVDHAGGALAAAVRGRRHTGTHVERGDDHRLHRLVTRLQEEVDRRRATPGAAPSLLLLVDGVDSVWTALEELAPGSGGAALLRLLREGAAAGLTAVLTADRVLPGSRLAGAATHRLVLPLADRADYAVAGVPARAVPGHRPPGRALLGDEALEVQLALPGEHPPAGPRGPALVVPGRIEVVELSPDPPTPAVGTSPAGVVALGPGGDDGGPVVLDLVRSGGLLITGPPGSGRSCTLMALAGRLAGAGTRVALVSGPRGPAAGGGVPGLVVVDAGGVPALQDWVAASAGELGIVLADDLGQLPDPMLDTLAGLALPGGSTVVVAAGAPADLTGFRGPAPALRRTRTALLLRPDRGDAELLSLRLPRAALPPRPGSGWLVTAGVPTRVQVSRR